MAWGAFLVRGFFKTFECGGRGGSERTHAHAIYARVFNTFSTMFNLLKVFSSSVDKLLKDFVENDSKAV